MVINHINFSAKCIWVIKTWKNYKTLELEQQIIGLILVKISLLQIFDDTKYCFIYDTKIPRKIQMFNV